MNKTAGVLWLVVLTIVSAPVRADLYQAVAAVERKDLPAAFAKFRELAELGHPLAQETLATMYVNGQGVARDNVLGYAWAKLAAAQGSRVAAQNIVDQVEPVLNDAQRARVAAVHARYGDAALRAELHPHPDEAWETEARKLAGCKMKSVADPDHYYPPEAKKRDISGTAVVDAPVLADGSTRSPIVVASYPAQVFDFASRQVAFLSTYFKNTNGDPCRVKFAVKFRVRSPAGARLEKLATEMHPKAAAGDPLSQLSYGLLVATTLELRQDGEKAWPWFLRAAQAGMAGGQYMTGLYLLHGIEVKADEAKALRWLELAIGNGSSEARLVWAAHHLRVDADPAMRPRAVEYLSQASDAANWQAKFYLASLLAEDSKAAWHDPRRALQLLSELQGGFDYDPAAFEIRAAANAAMGDFRAARSLQKRAIQKARQLKWDTTWLDDRLRAYEQDQPWDGRLIPF